MAEQQLTNFSLIGLSFILLMGILLIYLPRRLAPLPIFMCACFITLGQRIDILGLNFYALRILILFGWIRLIFRKEFSGIKLNTIDNVIIWWVIYSIVSYTLLYGSVAAFINRLGFAFNVIGLYFLFRFLIRDFNDIDNALKLLAIVVLPLAGIILVEYATGRNLFSIFGGVPELTVIRDGKPRCQGPFVTSITAGSFGATLVPLFVCLWFKEKHKIFSIAGLISATIITIASVSSGPLLSYCFALLGLAMWSFRQHMRFIRWGILFVLITLHVYMKAPIWYLIARISNFIGGHGYHRSQLINQAITHFNDWWLLGTTYTAHWMYSTLSIDPTMIDCTNQYISEGIKGGLLKMVLFIAIIVICFRELGRALRVMENQPFAVRFTLWSMGASLLAHMVTFTSITYFDQMIVLWYLLLAVISTVSDLSQTIRDQAEVTRHGLQNA